MKAVVAVLTKYLNSFANVVRFMLPPTGCFTDSGVVDLNRRAEKVMNELGVPILPAYDITRGQSWATAMRDGRCVLQCGTW